LSGTLTLTGTAQTGTDDAATRGWVQDQIALGQLSRGTWNPLTNTPSINAGDTVNGAFWTATVTGVINAGVPGIGGQNVSAGDRITWNLGLGAWEVVPSGGMTQGEADLRYLRMDASNTMTAAGFIVFPAAYVPSTDDHVATRGSVATQITNAFTTAGWTNPTGGVAWGRTAAGGWDEVLPLAGGALTGGLTGTTLTLSGALTGTSATLTTPLGLGSGGTGANSAVGALDALSGAAAGSAGALTRAAANTWGLTAVLTAVSVDTATPPSLTGNGTSGNPLVVGTIDGGTYT
jgi:hypothetical protein